LDLILGADVRIKEAAQGRVVKAEDVEEIIEEVVNEVKEWGYKPYVAPIGGSMVGGSMTKPLGAISYVEAGLEALDQAEKEKVEIDYFLLATGSGGTQAGLVVATKALNENIRVIGISVSEEKEPFSKEVLTISQDTIKALGLEIKVAREDIIVFDDYIKEGYGIVNREVTEAIRLVAQLEGIFLDPVYTGKAMVGLIDLIRQGYFKKEDKVAFFHTGGTPALFPNKHLLTRYLSDE